MLEGEFNVFGVIHEVYTYPASICQTNRTLSCSNQLQSLHPPPTPTPPSAELGCLVNLMMLALSENSLTSLFDEVADT